MLTFGHKLRYERESRNIRIQEVSEQTHIGLRYLEALENNDFAALPGPRGFGKLYIRAYAKMLGFDPQSLIDEFEKERRKQSKVDDDRPPREPTRAKRITYVPPPRKPVDPEPPTLAVAEPEPITEPEPVVVSQETIEPVVAAVLEPAKPRGRRIIGLALVAITLLIVAGVALRPKSTPPPAAAATHPAVTTVQPDTAPATVTPDPPAIEPVAVSTAVPGRISITESGVGTGVVDRRLVGQRTRFEEGSTVFFFTRVVGAAPGQKLRHVWLREGRVIQSRELPLGSAHWRTYSTKTLWGKGNWTVEARGADDRVLARADFKCEAP
jgi:transcriptional regulator with XRE-family HTH domain